MQGSPLVGADLCDKLLEACASLAEAELALLTVQTMRGLAIPVGYVAHGCVLRALCMAGRLEVDIFKTPEISPSIEKSFPTIRSTLDLECSLNPT